MLNGKNAISNIGFNQILGHPFDAAPALHVDGQVMCVASQLQRQWTSVQVSMPYFAYYRGHRDRKPPETYCPGEISAWAIC